MGSIYEYKYESWRDEYPKWVYGFDRVYSGEDVRGQRMEKVDLDISYEELMHYLASSGGWKVESSKELDSRNFDEASQVGNF